MARTYAADKTPMPDAIEAGSPEEAQALLEQWKAKNPFTSSERAPRVNVRAGLGSPGKPPGSEKTDKGIVTMPDGSPARAKDGKPVGAAQLGNKALPMSGLVSDALKKSPAERTAAEVRAIKQRREYEDYFERAGGKLDEHGVASQLEGETKAAGRGRSDAMVATTYQKSLEEGFKAQGFNADGTRIEAAQAEAKAAGPAASRTAAPGAVKKTDWRSQATDMTTRAMGGQPVAAPTAPAEPAAAPAQGSRGFAMRTMADGTVRTASGLARANTSNMKNFGTQAEALAFYGVTQPGQPAPAANKAATPITPAQTPAPVQPANPAAPGGVSPAAMDFLRTGKAPAAYDAINNPAPAATATAQPAPAKAATPAGSPAATAATVQTPEAARTTSPTAKLGMSGTSVPTTPAKTQPAAAPAPAPAAQPPLGGVPTSELLAQATGANPTPGQPSVGFGASAGELWNRVTKDAIWNHTPPRGGLYANPVNLGTANREIVGTPKKSIGYQKQAEDLNPRS